MQIDVLWTSPNARPAFERHLMAEGYGELEYGSLTGVTNVRQERRSRSDRLTQENYPRLTFTFEDGSTQVGYGRLVSADGPFGSISSVTFHERDEEIRSSQYENVIGATWVTRENRVGEEWEELEIIYWKPQSETFGIGSIQPDYAVIDRPGQEREIVGTHPLKDNEISYESGEPLSIEAETAGERATLENVHSVSPDQLELSSPDERRFRVHSEGGVLHEIDSIESAEGRTGRFQTVITDESRSEVKTRFGFLGGAANDEAMFAVTVNDRFGSPNASIMRSPMDSGFYNSRDYYSVRAGNRERIA